MKDEVSNKEWERMIRETERSLKILKARIESHKKRVDESGEGGRWVDVGTITQVLYHIEKSASYLKK